MSDTTLAFANLLDRAVATAPGPLPDRISLRDHVVSADIGAFQAERGQTQRIRFNLVVEIRREADAGAGNDDVDRILSYDRLTEAIALELAAERLNLLETLAERVAARILAEPRVLRVFVRVEKLDRGPGALGVEIARRRSEAAKLLPEDAPPRPLVVHLSNRQIASPDLCAQLDALEREGRPVVLCVGLPECPAPRSAVRAAQRRIDLLALEQNAWVLAGRDKRCVVVQSRTEIDWALRHGQMIVWAPSKLVLDAVESPRAAPQEGVALSLWLAEQLGAAQLVVLGMSAEVAPKLEAAGSIPVEWRAD